MVYMSIDVALEKKTYFSLPISFVPKSTNLGYLLEEGKIYGQNSALLQKVILTRSHTALSSPLECIGSAM